MADIRKHGTLNGKYYIRETYRTVAGTSQLRSVAAPLRDGAPIGSAFDDHFLVCCRK